MTVYDSTPQRIFTAIEGMRDTSQYVISRIGHTAAVVVETIAAKAGLGDFMPNETVRDYRRELLATRAAMYALEVENLKNHTS